ncbi:MAG: thioredoxin domain-containing protein [Candidatus Omnitrophica bacterium]|nr:thioredoxin domain-containing protein [Candidatus Omnitrophota bacterium]
MLAHADNPVFWYPWGPQAFAAAIQADKPVLLSIGYSTCHWCHVMAHESFENEDIAKVLNDHFIAVKVDREERPDVDHVYMAAVVAMTGQGGWPLTVFLTPDGKPFYGGTYFPPYTGSGSQGFKEILLSIAEAWHNNREGILSSSDEITRSLNVGAGHAQPLQGNELSGSILDAAFHQMSARFDAANGGFGSSPKFPMPHGLGFLLRYHHRVPKDEKALAMVEQTLVAMARGGIWDHIGFGFHRYSTDAQWHVPHFEKMLYDQALLAHVYLEAFQVTGKKTYADVAENIFIYVLGDMCEPQGGFYCAQDADSPVGAGGPGGHRGPPVQREGAFYVWTEKEIIEVLGPKEGDTFCAWYGVKPDGPADGGAAFDPHGEFAGKNILFLSQEPDDEQMAARCRQRLFERRQKRPRPHLDDKVIVDWNGLMICALAFGGRVLGKKRYVDAARAAADFILSHLVDDGRLLHRWRQGQAPAMGGAGLPAGKAGIPATLEDYAFFVTGLIDLYEASFEEKYLEQAKRLAHVMQELFEDGTNGGFYMTARDAQTLITRPKEIYDGAIPSGNSASALALLRLHALTGEEGFYASASGVFTCFSGVIRQAPSAYPLALCAYDFYREGATQVVLSGPLDPSRRGLAEADETIAKMTKVLYKHFVPNRSVVYEAGAQKVMARVCKGRACLPPTDDPAVLERQIGDVHEGR